MAEFLGGCVAGVASSVVRVWLCGLGRGVVIRGHRRCRRANKEDSIKDTIVSESSHSCSPTHPLFPHLFPATIYIHSSCHGSNTSYLIGFQSCRNTMRRDDKRDDTTLRFSVVESRCVCVWLEGIVGEGVVL